MSDEINRRNLFVKAGLLFDVVVGVLIGLPIVRYLSSPVSRGAHGGYDSWLSLGAVDRFPVGETRLAEFQNPVMAASDGATAKVACWVRRVDETQAQVFAINCAHLGCPVRWFPQSGLFMCPCHGGAYYADGGRASGPPERGLFEYPHRIENGQLMIQAGELPTPGASSAHLDNERPPCA
jgi:nitrite reductase/ring-hydroxylating ferredoxin subunit